MRLAVKNRLKTRIKRRKKSSERIFKIKKFVWQKRAICSLSWIYRLKKLKKKKLLLKKSFLVKKKFKNTTITHYSKIKSLTNKLVVALFEKKSLNKFKSLPDVGRSININAALNSIRATNDELYKSKVKLNNMYYNKIFLQNDK